MQKGVLAKHGLYSKNGIRPKNWSYNWGKKLGLQVEEEEEEEKRREEEEEEEKRRRRKKEKQGMKICMELIGICMNTCLEV